MGIRQGILLALVFVPVLAAIPVLLVPSGRAVRLTTLIVTIFELALSLVPFAVFMQPRPDGWLVRLDLSWIPAFGVNFALGLDGISLLMAALTAFLFMLSVLVSWDAIRDKSPMFHFMLLVMETGVMGVFLSTDLFLFYLFWEVMLVPMFFLIGVWGHGRKVYSAVKFFVYTFTGSLFMLLAIIGLYVIHGSQAGEYTFALEALKSTHVEPATGLWLFAAFFIGFAVKVPVFPIHSWLPDAHTDAPTAGSVILAGLLLKTGAYGLIRFGFPLFPEASAAYIPVILAVGIIGVYYAAWIAYAQEDMKRLVAYSSISHLGFVVLGIAAWNEVSLAGSVLQMVNHGITTGALFIMVGMLDERRRTRDINAFGGLWAKAPGLSAFFLLFIVSSLGLPGLNNFAGELLILVGIFKDYPYLAASALAGVVFTLIYLLRLAQKVLFGPPATDAEFHDLSPREAAILVPLAVLVVVIGLCPRILIGPIEGPVKALVSPVAAVKTAGATPQAATAPAQTAAADRGGTP
ncbi:MAG: NADH-quinone oxidoreductase subunit M [Nitrospirae bacterium]|nr:NADH-quinone oxidoreductase subunit M [Nitrospirota bacterium]